ncbi:MAG: glycosyl transferase family 1, partial [Bacteroidales bacterium]|nr:glycosyl transferase family 1 [Bacteroidales bacterium]
MARLLLLGPAHPYRGGIAASTEQLARTLQQQGHEVEVCSFRLQYPSLLFPGKSQFSTSPPPRAFAISRGDNPLNPLNRIHQGRYIKQKRNTRKIV